MYWSSDPFLMLAEEHVRDLYEDARRAARVHEATARRRPRGFGIYGWIGRALAARSAPARLRTAERRGASAEPDRGDRERRPAA